MLKISRGVVFTLFPVVFWKVHLFPRWMVFWMHMSMRWVNKCMLYIKWLQSSSEMWGVNLKSRPESSVVYIWCRSLMTLVTKRLERIMMFNIKHRVIWERVRSPVSRLDSQIRWIWEMIDLIFYIILFKETGLLSFW